MTHSLIEWFSCHESLSATAKTLQAQITCMLWALLDSKPSRSSDHRYCMVIAAEFWGCSYTCSRWIAPYCWESSWLFDLHEVHIRWHELFPYILMKCRFDGQAAVQFINSLPVAESWITHLTISSWIMTETGKCSILFVLSGSLRMFFSV